MITNSKRPAVSPRRERRPHGSKPDYKTDIEAGNEQHAADLIEQAIRDAKASRTSISHDAAQLIAATVHHGPDTALGRFAATGELNRIEVTTELWNTGIYEIPIGWWHAFDQFLQVTPSDPAEETQS